MTTDTWLRIILVGLLIIILLSHAGFLTILWSNYKRKRVATTRAVLVLFIALTVMFLWKITGFVARIVPYYPLFITILLILDIFVLLFIITAELKLLKVIYGFSFQVKRRFRRWLKGWLDDS